ncbi:hypothetical protein GCM10025867_25690 [Frondihabitans sucicola]|uniref:Uncharacterized protein n=1 Tax=Frondihabitans sucicola TaxID=1268041 RepID=A0ABN6Y2V4_9MICO|nr:hypothetical protein [Frondihabitans sucicola]BDZ50328.1 hypothetical protein GCM10025867_25690 [Frondihabitans sucicola]
MPQGIDGLRHMQAKQQHIVADITRWLASGAWQTARFSFAQCSSLHDARG